MKAYLVGGAVRDGLLQRPVVDRDYVVVGATVEELLAEGFMQVGEDFPVFLHPQTSDAYAMARTNRVDLGGVPRKADIPPPTVTLEEDLSRRDLTVNAMAQGEDGVIVDPFGGQRDLADKVLRHVSDAFSEDPMRVLRLARFAARYQGFRVAEDTVDLCRELSASGALDNLVAERVWQEIARGLMEDKPSTMFDVLRQLDALRVVLPEVDQLWGVPQPVAHHPEVDTGVHVMMALDAAAAAGAPLEVRYAVLMHDLGKGVTPADVLPSHPDHEKLGAPLVRQVNTRFRVPSSAAELAVIVCEEHTRVHRALEMKATSFITLLARVDAYRRPQRLEWLLQACEFDARGRLGLAHRPYPQADRVRTAASAARAVDAGAVARASADPQKIPEKVYNARVSAVKAAFAA